MAALDRYISVPFLSCCEFKESRKYRWNEKEPERKSAATPQLVGGRSKRKTEASQRSESQQGKRLEWNSFSIFSGWSAGTKMAVLGSASRDEADSDPKDVDGASITSQGTEVHFWIGRLVWSCQKWACSTRAPYEQKMFPQLFLVTIQKNQITSSHNPNNNRLIRCVIRCIQSRWHLRTRFSHMFVQV